MSRQPLRGQKVGIVGASVGGLAAARFLREYGADVKLLERSRSRLEERGGGIAMDPGVVGLLGSIQGRSIEGRIVIGASGRPLWTRPAQKFMTAWSEVYAALHRHVPETIIGRGQTVEHCEALDDSSIVHVSHQKSPQRFDLVIGADGLGSIVRHAVAPEFEPEYVGYVAIRGQVNEESLPSSCDRLRGWAGSPGLVNCYGPRTHLVTYWIPGAKGKVLNWMWYQNVEDQNLQEFMSDASGRSHHWSLPPGMLSDRRRERLLDELTAIFPKEFSVAAAATNNLYFQAIYKGVPSQLARKRVALVGDAAHVLAPHIGAGSTFAIQDAQSLADALADTAPDIALDTWAAERRNVAASAMTVAGDLGHALQHEDHDWENWAPDDFETWWDELMGRSRLYFESGNE